ncbi:STF2-like protein [Fonsecaea pedrosoi]|nr:STF2-like protein [Fonsecaea pedrosoi]
MKSHEHLTYFPNHHHNPPSITSTFSTNSIPSVLALYSIMTRTNKGNDRNHSAIADGSALPEERLPRYFAKHGHVDADPKGVKKQGGGKGNWGREGDEVHDYDYKFTNSRRRSNSSTQVLGDFKTKFETVDAEPVFEEGLHGPTDEDIEKASTLSKEESTDSSTLGGSYDDEDKKL